MFKLSIKNFLIFCVVWGAIGFMMGTEILMGPSRWAIDFARSKAELNYLEGPAIRLMILALVAVSLPLALFLTRTILKTKLKHVRYGLIAIITICMTATLYMWFNPKKFGNDKPTTTLEAERFTVGSYPDLAKLKELKKEGYTGVISLLHPAVVPFETSLIAKERADAEKAGIDMIHLPMLPWISQNAESLAKLNDLAATGQGKYYLHCYLGKGRVSVAMRTIAAADKSMAGALGERARKLSERDHLERGRVFMPDENVYVIPYPTDEEYFAYIIAANITNIVCLMNPDEGSSLKIITRSEEILASYKIQQINTPIGRERYDHRQARAAVDIVKKLEGPVVVFDYFCPTFRTEAFIQAYSTDKPVFPPSLVGKAPLVGPVEPLAPNVIAGPRPDKLREFVELERLGIRKFLYLGSADDADAKRDREFTRVGKFEWQVAPTNISKVISILSTDGPWYIYGPEYAKVRAAVADQLGPSYIEPLDHTLNLTLEEPETSKPAGPTRFTLLVADINKGKMPDWLNPIKVGMDFLMAAAPSLRMIILFSPFCLIYTYICASFAGRLKMERQMRTPYTRKVFHFLIFTMACLVQLVGGLPATVLYGTLVSCCVLYAIYRGDGFGFYEAMARPTDAPHRTLYIIIPLITTALGGVLANIFFQPVAYIGYLVGGWGDAIGEPAGSRWGKHKYKVPSMMAVPATRSLEGSAAVGMAGFLAAMLGLVLIGAPLGLAASAALICALATVIIEAVSTHGMDNLTVQVAASAVMYFLLQYLG